MVDRINRNLPALFGVDPIKAFQMSQMGIAPRVPVSITGRSGGSTVFDVNRPNLMTSRNVPSDRPQARPPLGAPTMFDMPLARNALTRRPPTGTVQDFMKTPQGMLQKLQSDKAFSAGLGAAGDALMKASGYTTEPKDTLSMIGTALSAFRKAQDEMNLKQAEANKPEIKIAGDKVFRVYPDGRIELLSGGGAKQPKIKGEAGRIMIGDRITQAVYDEQGNLYEVGNMGVKLDPKEVKYIDQFTSQSVQQMEKHKKDEIKPKEKTLKYIDTLAAQIMASPSGWLEREKTRIRTALKAYAGKTDYTEEELAYHLSKGTLTALVGASRLELFGPGVLTEAEAELARQVFVGDFDTAVPEIALRRLNNFREMTLPNYIESIGIYNASPATTLTYKPYYSKRKIFDWDSWLKSQGDKPSSSETPPSSGQPSGGSTGSTSGGNSWTLE